MPKTHRKQKKVVGQVHKRLNGNSISKRPKIVNKRKKFGHWEINTVIGKRSKDQILLTLTERKTRQYLIVPLATKCAEAVVKANMIPCFHTCARSLLRTMELSLLI
jgi:IS30 family transposase